MSNPFIHENTFTVYPSDCNYMKVSDGSPMVHGGTLLLKMDRASAELARRCLYGSECDSALTVGVESVKFLDGAKLGDIIKVKVEAIGFGSKRMTFKVECFVESFCLTSKECTYKKIAEGIYSFCSFANNKSFPHNLRTNEKWVAYINSL
jgi:acyl-CoA hydrolase